MTRTRVMIGADSLERGASGIGRVARLMARVLAEEVRGGTLSAEGVALNDRTAPRDLGIPARTAQASRLRFVSSMLKASLTHTHFLYDFTGIARAHIGVPPFRRPYLTWIHGIEIWEDARADRLRRAREADVLVANTEYTRARASALHRGLTHTQVCWLATEEDEEPAAMAIEREPAALILSRLDTAGGYKGHRELVDAWPEVARAVPGARLLIAGDGPGRDVIRAWRNASPVREQIELLGFVPEASLPALWSRARVFAMPSRGEGFGLAYIEAMRHGLPTVASVHDAAIEVNEDGVTGYNVDLERSGDLPERLIHLLREPAECARMGEAGRARWRRHFRFSAFRERFRPLLARLLA